MLLLVPRVAIGLGITVAFGAPKIAHFQTYLSHVARSGLPLPGVIAVALLLVELIGGFALAIGIFTRLAGAALLLAMLGIMLAPTGDPFPWDTTPFALGGYFFGAIGPGRVSIDYLLARHARRRGTSSDRGYEE